MKRKFLYLLLVGFVCTFCSKDDPGDTPSKPVFSVDLSTVSVPEASTLKIKVTAPQGTTWKVKDPEINWLTVSPLTGTGSGEVTLTASKIVYREKREAAVWVITEDTQIEFASRSIKINVTGAIPNTAPSKPVKAVYPLDKAKDVPEIYMRLQWADAVDAEGDRISYIVEYSKDQQTWTKNNVACESPSCTFYSQMTGNTTYYWRVSARDIFGAESAVSEVFSFTTATLGAWKDAEVRMFQNNGNGSADAFTLIVTCDGFTSSDMAAGGNWENISLSAINGLLENTEPYKTYRSYLRIYRIAAVSPQSGISQHQDGAQNGICTKVVKTKFGSMYDNVSTSAWTGLFDSVSPSTGGSIGKVFNWVDSCLVSQNIHVEKNYAVLVIQNVAHYNGLVNYYWENGKNRTMGFVCLSPGTKGSQTGFENVVTHEIGGHAIGHLADLYQTSPTATLTEDRRLGTLELQKYGWYQNVDVSGDKTKSPWAHFLSSAEYSVYYSKVGYYEGARSVGKGIWRPEYEAGCMNTNQFYFDGPSRYSIIKQLKAAAGESLTWAEFVNKDYDHGNAVLTKSAVVDPNLPRLPEPVFWR